MTGSMQTPILIIHTLIALAIIILVLVQRGKGAEAGAAFGAGASGTVFGSRGSTSFFSRATAVLATAFFATSLTLAYISSQSSSAPESLIEDAPVVETQDQVPAEAPTEAPTEDAVPELPEADSTTDEPEESSVPPLDVEPPAEETTPEE